MPKTKPRKTTHARDTYMELVQRFPLKTIKNDDEHAEATDMIPELMGRKLDSGAGDYLDALLVLVNKYEDEHHAIDETMTPQQALRSLMESNGLSQADIGRIIARDELKADDFFAQVVWPRFGRAIFADDSRYGTASPNAAACVL
jgi:antitoxin component HigA of HigAB toxin-antitoxin module